MSPSSSLATWLLVWLAAAAVIFLGRGKSLSAGLVPAFVLNYAMGYLFGAAIYLLPGWHPYHDPDTVAVGFQVSTYGLVAFAFGSVVLARIVARGAQPVQGAVPIPPLRLIHSFIVVGLVSMLVLLPILGRVPTAGAVVSQGWNLLIVGLGLACWGAWNSGKHVEFGRWLAATFCLPAITVLTQGFLGYGTVASIAVLSFIGSFYRPRWRVIVASTALLFVAMSLFVTYMRDRNLIRDSVWGGDPIATRVQRVYTTVSTFEWIDTSNEDHLLRIDVRLNQNFLVGAAVDRIDRGLAQFAHGRNLVEGVLSIIPRAIWPSKPFMAGSGNVVSEYTGIQFAQGTAVGIGSLLEAYISFGTAGVIGGFILLGMVVGVMDTTAGQRLLEGDWAGFTRWFLPGLALLQVEGSVIELTSSIGAALVVAFLVSRFLIKDSSRKPTVRRPVLRSPVGARPT